MAKAKTAEQIIKAAQAQEDREYARRVARIKRAVSGADFRDSELSAIEAVVFGAFGRTKLR